jgi:hypothetical protein
MKETGADVFVSCLVLIAPAQDPTDSTHSGGSMGISNLDVSGISVGESRKRARNGKRQ